MLNRNFPEGIKINDLMPKVKIEDATEEYDWFDKGSDDEEDLEGIDVLAPLVSEQYQDEPKKEHDSNSRDSPPGLLNPITWDDMDNVHEMSQYLHEHDSDVDSLFDTQHMNNAIEHHDRRRENINNYQQVPPSSPVHAMIDRKFSGNEDIYISDEFGDKLVGANNNNNSHRNNRMPLTRNFNNNNNNNRNNNFDYSNNRGSSPPPQLANLSTPWSGTVTTAVMPTNQGMWVFVPQPPATDPGRSRSQGRNGMNRNNRFQQSQHQQQQQRNHSTNGGSSLKITRSWNLDDVNGNYNNNNGGNRRARTTSPRNRNQYFHYNTESGNHPMGNTFATSPPRSRRGASSRSPRRRLFTESNNNISTYTNNFGNDIGTASSNPHQRIRALKDMISSLESSIGALSNGEGAPM